MRINAHLEEISCVPTAGHSIASVHPDELVVVVVVVGVIVVVVVVVFVVNFVVFAIVASTFHSTFPLQSPIPTSRMVGSFDPEK